MTNNTGTEGQVGHYDRTGRGQARGGPCRGERTQGRPSRLGRRGLASSRTGRTASAATHLRGIEGRGPEEGPQLTEVDASLARQCSGERAAGDGAQRRSADGWCRRQGSGGFPGEIRMGRLGAAPLPFVDSQAGQARVSPQGQRKAAPNRYSCGRRQDLAGPGVERVGARVGGAVRAEDLWFSAEPWLS